MDAPTPTPTTAPPGAEAVPPGYRAVRRLARLPEGEEWFADTTSPAPRGADSGTRTSATHSVVTIADDESERVAAATLLGASSRLQSRHLGGVVDVGSSPEGAVVLERRPQPQGSLDDLLSTRDRLSTGECVTILAPLLALVDTAHAAGLIVGSIRAADVHFAHDGAPVLALTVGARPVARGMTAVAREAHPEFAEDRRGVVALCQRVVARAHGVGADAARDAVARHGALDDDALEQIRGALFSVAAGAPVRFGTATTEPVVDGGARLTPLTAPVGSRAASGTVRRWAGVFQLPPWLDPLLERAVEATPGSALRARMGAGWRGLGSRSRRLMVGLAAGVLAASLTALALEPTAPADGVGPAVDSADSADLAAPADSAGTAHDGDAESAPSAETAPPDDSGELAPDPSAVGSDAEDAAAEDAAAALVADDPLAALPHLLARRDQCAVERSLLCLDEVHQAGSASLAADRAALTGADEGDGAGEGDGAALFSPVTMGEPYIVERLGDAVLIDLGRGSDVPEAGDTGSNAEPASLLMMRSEAGWRIREFLAESG